jgi:hypothetical protein
MAGGNVTYFAFLAFNGRFGPGFAGSKSLVSINRGKYRVRPQLNGASLGIGFGCGQ